MLVNDKIKNKILDFESNMKTLDFDYQIEGESFKIAITRKGFIEKEEDLFGIDINIFNGTLDYSIINYGGEIIEHKYYEKFDLEFLFIFLEKIISSFGNESDN